MLFCTSEASAAISAPPPASTSHASATRRQATVHNSATRNTSNPTALDRNSASWKPMPALDSSAVDRAMKPQVKA